jgi:hypothetical protein
MPAATLAVPPERQENSQSSSSSSMRAETLAVAPQQQENSQSSSSSSSMPTATLDVAPQQQENNSQSSSSSSMPTATLDVAPERQENSHSSSSATLPKSMTCNRWFFNVDTEEKERCGKWPIVLNAKKQHYCKEHSQQRCVSQKRNRIVRKEEKEEAATKSKTKTIVPSSMSLLCAISEDGFFLDIFPGSHLNSFFKGNSQTDPIHFSSSQRIHVPQTYMILFHKFFFHCGSAAPENEQKKTGQHRLFAYVNTVFLETDAMKELEYKELRSQHRSSDIPDAGVVCSKPYIFCCSQMSRKWLCSKCDEEKVIQRENNANFQTTTEWDRTVPGTVVAGNMKQLGYVILRTSITKDECPYLLAMEKEMSDSNWDNISSSGKQNSKATREQYPLEDKGSNIVKEVFKIPFFKLRKDILKMDKSLGRPGYWTQGFLHKKLLRNNGPVPKQYPHCDYNFSVVRFREELIEANKRKRLGSKDRGKRKSIKKNKKP